MAGVEYFFIAGGESFTKILKTPNTAFKSNQTLDDKVQSQKGNSPNSLLRSLKFYKC